jgi:rhodanese-related sulfurtransferase
VQFAQLIEFAGNHWMLVAALVVILVLLAINLAMGEKGNVDPLGAISLINHQDAVVVDVRPAADFSKGHIINSMNIPMNSFPKQISTLERHKERPIVVTCRSGGQSSQACAELRKHGFANVLNLRGGILGWQSASLPLTRKGR